MTCPACKTAFALNVAAHPERISGIPSVVRFNGKLVTISWGIFVRCPTCDGGVWTPRNQDAVKAFIDYVARKNREDRERLLFEQKKGAA